MRKALKDQSSWLTIGAVSRASGIPTNTLRTWERRYGFPEPRRTDGGHRLYPKSVVEHLIAIRQALAAGRRPGQVVGAPLSELCGPGSIAKGSVGWLESYNRGGVVAFRQWVSNAHARLGARGLVIEVVAPLLVEIGDAWRSGKLSVPQEHELSASLTQMLTSIWYPFCLNEGPSMLLGTLSGERHAMGLHLVAIVVGYCGWRPVFVGADVPWEDFAKSASRVDAVGVSLSDMTSDLTVHQLKKLVESCGCPVLIGGGGAPELPGTVRIQSLESLERWAQEAVRTYGR